MPYLWSKHRSCRLWKQGINSHFFPRDGERDRSGDVLASASERGRDFCWVWIRSFVLLQSFQPAIHLFVLGSASSSDQLLLMLFCCHGHHVLLYAPRCRLHSKNHFVITATTARLPTKILSYKIILWFLFLKETMTFLFSQLIKRLFWLKPSKTHQVTCSVKGCCIKKKKP